MSQRRVVVTGLGIISCIGNDAETVTESLKNGTAGIKHDPKMAELGFRSQVSGRPDDTSDLAKEVIGKRSLRFMGDAAIWSGLAMAQAIEDAGLSAFRAGELDRQRFMYNLARIWAGLPLPNGRSYYQGHAGNAATMTWAAFEGGMTQIWGG